jgi:inorganic pyrophosphatase
MILKDFFANYKNNENKVTVIEGFGDRSMAIDIINKSFISS